MFYLQVFDDTYTCCNVRNSELLVASKEERNAVQGLSLRTYQREG